jgi:hypothetical protein
MLGDTEYSLVALVARRREFVHPWLFVSNNGGTCRFVAVYFQFRHLTRTRKEHLRSNPL